MSQPELKKMLLNYLTSIPKSTFKRKMMLEYPAQNEKELDEITGKLQQFCSLCKDDSILLLFPFILNNIRFAHPELHSKNILKLLWEKGFSHSIESKENLKKMYTIWSNLEKDVQGLTKEKLNEKEKKVEFERLL